MDHHSHDTHVEKTREIPKPQTAHIWRVALILGVLTALEFLIALGLDWSHLTKTTIFVLMTFVKAFYIVGEFMHLRHEVKTLIWSLLIPVVFVIWLIIALLVEGNAILDVR